MGEGAWLEYAPEALYPHRGTDYAQHTRLELAAGATTFYTDQLAPGAYMKLGIEGIAPHCLEAVRPEFAGAVEAAEYVATAIIARRVAAQ